MCDDSSVEARRPDLHLLGQVVEHIPSNYQNWTFYLTEERNFKMEQNINSEQKPITVFDVMIADEASNGRTYWRNVGAAFPLTNGSPGFSMKLHMFPNLRMIVKESIRPVGAAKANANNTEGPPF